MSGDGKARPGAFSLLANRRMLSTLLLGFSSGLPIALTSGTLQAWLTDRGVGLRSVAAFTLVGLPYTLKFLWAPLLDRFQLPLLGRRRGWILLLQCALGATILAYAGCDPQQQRHLLAALALLLATLSASQDIAFDAYRTDVLEPAERGLGAAASVAGYRAAMITSGAAALIAADRIGWPLTFSCLAALMFSLTLASWWAPEPVRVLAAPRTLTAAVSAPLREFASRGRALWIAILIVSYKLGDAMALSLSTPFLKDIGFSNTDIGLISKGFGLGATIAGAFAGGLVLARIGLYRALLVLGIAQALTILPYATLALGGREYGGLIGAIGVQNFGDGMGTAAFVALLTALCNLRFTAFQYALFSALASQGRVLFGPLAARLVDALGWAGFFTLCAAVGCLALCLVRFLRAQIAPLDATAGA